jgi:hypothetical protein
MALATTLTGIFSSTDLIAAGAPREHSVCPRCPAGQGAVPTLCPAFAETPLPVVFNHGGTSPAPRQCPCKRVLWPFKSFCQKTCCGRRPTVRRHEAAREPRRRGVVHAPSKCVSHRSGDGARLVRPAVRGGRRRLCHVGRKAGRGLRVAPPGLHLVPHNPNTNSIVALPCDLSSGERAILARPTGPIPDAMAMYCLPFTA